MGSNFDNHSNVMNGIYKNPEFLEAIDLWTSYFVKNKDDILYSNWRHLNSRRQKIEN